jgi:hypothetical protein
MGQENLGISREKARREFLDKINNAKIACLPENFALSSEHVEQFLKNKMSIIAVVSSLIFAKKLAVKRQVNFAPNLRKLCLKTKKNILRFANKAAENASSKK